MKSCTGLSIVMIFNKPPISFGGLFFVSQQMDKPEIV
jgi:hypothetical protein